MTNLAEDTTAALRTAHDDLAAVVPRLTDAQLTGPSGAAEWTVAQVLSHLGSGAEIALAGARAALAGQPAPGQDANLSVWARWDALGPQEQAAGYLERDEQLVRTFEELPPGQRDATSVELGFLPAPLPLASVMGMRLHELAQHSWDVRVALDPAAEIGPTEARVLVEHFTGGLAFLLGFLGKPDRLAQPAAVEVADTGLTLLVGDGVRLTRAATEPTARFEAGAAPALRLLAGRLRAPYVPAGLQVTGNVTLADLQQVFPGF